MEDLRRRGLHLEGRRLVYCDPSGAWAELVLADGTFIRLVPLPGAPLSDLKK